MPAWSPTGSATTPRAPPVRGVTFAHRSSAAEQPHFNLWCASQRKLSVSALDSARNTQSVYVKGLMDTYRIEIQNAPWEWRRIVFATKARMVGGNDQSQTYLQSLSFEDRTAANARVVGQGTAAGQPAIQIEGTGTGIDAFDDVFKGLRGVDWTNYFTASTDKSLIKVLSDKRFRVSSGNESGAAKVKKFYTPINKTLVYDDQENGTDQLTNGWSSNSAGIGNIYVLDMFWNEAGGDITVADMIWTAESTMYWHEL